VATIFHLLQDVRHEADYNKARRFTRQEASDSVDLAEEAFQAWVRIRGQAEAKVFLISLLLWRQWNRA